MSAKPWASGEFEVYKRGDDVKLSTHFHLREFECKCGKCAYTIISPRLVDMLDLKRERIGRPIKINSGFRCYGHNVTIGGKIFSSHLLGLAADIWYSGYEEGKYLHEFSDFDGVGVYETFMHVDVRGHIARWGLKKGIKNGTH